MKLLLVFQDLFDWGVDAERMKKTLQTNRFNIYIHDYNKELTQKVWVEKSTEFVGEFEKHCKVRDTELLYN